MGAKSCYHCYDNESSRKRKGKIFIFHLIQFTNNTKNYFLVLDCLKQRKCDMYWPKEGIETYGVIQVKLVKEDVMATYTVRTLQIRHLRVNCLFERYIY